MSSFHSSLNSFFSVFFPEMNSSIYNPLLPLLVSEINDMTDGETDTVNCAYVSSCVEFCLANY
jgi:hypothetical protein